MTNKSALFAAKNANRYKGGLGPAVTSGDSNDSGLGEERNGYCQAEEDFCVVLYCMLYAVFAYTIERAANTLRPRGFRQ